MASHRRISQPGLVTVTKVTVLSAAAAGAAATLTASPAGADPGPAAADVRTRVESLYEQAEAATEKYNGAQERTRKLRAEVASLQDRTARGQERINRMRNRLGAIAAAQYRSGGVDPTVGLMLSEKPADFLDKATVLDRVNGTQADELRELQGEQRVLEQRRRETAARLRELEISRKEVSHRKQDVEHKLATAQRLLNALSGPDRKEYDRASRQDGRSGPPPALPAAPAGAGRSSAAVRAALSAVGSPYAWGQSGPSAFDCSGLMQWAYARAGVALPRTSQAQRFAGRRISLDQAQPGDLVVYRDDASHVGMYVGNGQVVHAPYPGARVRQDPVGMMPISSVTRP
ncbi:C40 family peptidase [Streptomyces sp. MST-110588]|uniref:C40 family peptidase n=1 Tax=Streptomyces sp. MST-110588 TaxID=2833628 RepID=UPI001F5D0B3A|nr:C40 family peptidase [Streptomyces sp. MST-110588]UNO42539.1 C40 family peptidase [Streptomyces sp. MST-110588]